MANADFDINRYALGIELALNTGQAFQALDALGERAEAIEQQIASAAQRSLGALGRLASATVSALANMSQHLSDIASSSQQALAPHLKLQDATGEMVEQQHQLALYHQQETQFYDQQQQTFEDIRGLQVIQGELALEMLLAMRAITEAIRLKNLGHQAQNRHMVETNELAEEGNQQFATQQGHVHDIARSWRHLLFDLLALRGMYGLINRDVERYHTANFRALGTQMQIVQATTDLTEQYGILRDAALDTYEALGNLKIPRQQLIEYSRAVALTNRITGVGTVQLADYVARLQGVGFTAQQSTQQLSWMSRAMRTLRLNTEDMTKAMQGTQVSALRLSAIFAEGPDAPAKFDRLKTIMMGLGKQFNMSADGLHQLMEKVADPVFNEFLSDVSGFTAGAGHAINSVSDLHHAMGMLGLQAAELQRKIQLGGAAGRDAAMELKVLSEGLQLTDQDSMILLAHLGEFQQGLAGTAEGAALLKLELSDHARALQQLHEGYAEATRTVTRAMQQISARFQAMLVTVQYWVESFLGPVLEWVATGIHALGWMVDKFEAGLNYLDSWMPKIGIWHKPFSALAGGIVVLGGSFIALTRVLPGLLHWLGRLIGTGGTLGRVLTGMQTAVVTLFTTIGTSFSTLLTTMQPGVQALGRMLVGMARSVALSIRTLSIAVGNAIMALGQSVGIGIQAALYGLGRGLAFLGAAVTGVLPQLLALGGAFVLVGAGAYLLAQGVRLVAQQGAAGLAGLAALTVAVTVLGGALVGLAYLAAPVAPVMLLIGGALALAGAGAWLLGAGLQAAARAFWMIVDAVGPHSPPMWEKMVLITAGVAALTVAAVVGAGPLLALSGALALAAGAAWLLNLALGGGGLIQLVGLLGGALGGLARLVQGAFGGVGSVLGRFSRGITGAFQALAGGLGSAGRQIYDYFGNLFGRVFTMLGGFTAAMWDAGKQMVNRLWVGVRAAFTDPLGFAGWLLSSLWSGVRQAGAQLLGWGGWLVGQLVSGLRAGLAAIPAGLLLGPLGALLPGLQQLGGRLLTLGGQLAGALLRGVQGVLAGGLQPLRQLWADWSGYLAGLTGRALQAGRQLLQALLKGISQGLGGVAQALAGGMAAVGNWLGGLAGQARQWGAQLMGGAAVGVAQGRPQLVAAAAAGNQQLQAGWAALVAATPGYGLRLVAGLISGVRSGGAGLVQLGAGLMRSVLGGLRAVGGELQQLGAGVAQQLGAGLRAGAAGLQQAAAGLVSGLRGAVQAGLTAVQGLFQQMFGSVDVSWVDQFLLKVQSLNQVAGGIELAFRRLAASGQQLIGLGSMFGGFAAQMRAFLQVWSTTLAQLDGGNLGQVISQRFQGMDQAVQGAVQDLDRYGALLEQAVHRIEAVLLSRAMPVLAMARQQGLDEVVRAESISTVQVRHVVERSDQQQRSPDSELLERIDGKLGALLTAAGSLVANRTGEEIRSLLEQYLANAGGDDGGGALSSQLNDWS